MIIYKITNTVNNKVYIGQTIRDLETRIQEHFRATDTFYLHSAIKHYGADKFIYECIDSATSREELNEKECMWIRYYNSDVEGYNMTEGGSHNPMNSSEVYAKHLNRMRSPEVRAKISATMKKRIADVGFTEEHRKRISNKMKNNKHYQGHKRSAEAIEATAKSLRKTVYCIDEQGNVVAEFTSVKSAAEWWYNKGYKIQTLCDSIKRSCTKDVYIHGLKWIYK